MNLIARYTSDTEDRITFIRWTICLAFLATIFVAPQLWFMQFRTLPACPVIKGFSLPDILSTALAVVLVVSLLIVFWGKFLRWSILTTLANSFILVLHDINRLQPPFYVFLVFLVFLFLYYANKIPRTHTTTAFQLIVCAVYFWSGVHKLNDAYLDAFYFYFMRAFIPEMPTGFWALVFESFGRMSAWIELLLPLMLLFLPFKRISLAMVVFMHLFILLALGIHGINYCIFPWNVMMTIISVALFYNSESLKFSSFKNVHVAGVFIMLWLLPIFNRYNIYDDFLAFDLYSGKYPNAVIYLHKDLVPKLPGGIQSHIEMSEKKQYKIRLLYWAEQDLHTPMYPAERVFKHYLRYIQSFANSRDEAGMVIFRNGKMKEVR